MKKSLIFILSMIILFVAGCSCQRRPDPEHYKCSECFKEADCYYRNQKSNDKTACADWGKECRAFKRYQFCKDKSKRDESHDFEKCWIYRNQK